MTKSNSIYIFLSPLLLAISIFVVWFLPMNNWWCAVLMCANFSWILFITWKSEGLTPFFLFLATFIFLFIGGRFWAVLMGHEPYELTRGNFFKMEQIEPRVWLTSLTYILLFLYTATLAYIALPKKNRDKSILSGNLFTNQHLDIGLTIVWCLIAPFILYDVLHKFYVAMVQGAGYLSLYADQMKDVVPGSGFIASMLYVFFGIAMVFGSERTRKLFLLLVFFKALVFILIGQRGKFGCVLLFFIWYYYRNRKINIVRLGTFALVSIVIIAILVAMSSRDANSTLAKPHAMLDEFLFSQGVSISTFTFSQTIDNYPLVPYLVSFIPGYASFYSFFNALPAYEAGFANYLAYSLNYELYESGHGLGWTLLSDLYLYSGRTYIGFIVLSILFGLVCAKVEDASKTSALAATIIYTIFLNFTFLPRAGLYTIIPLIVWTVIMYYIFVPAVATRIRVSQVNWNY